MSGRRKKRKKRSRKERRRALLEGVRKQYELDLSVSTMELARGHDGFMRGKPEPVVLLACYQIAGDETAVLGRSVVRTKVSSGFPCVVRPFEPGRLRIPLGANAEALSLAILALAFEEDSGAAVKQAYADLSYTDGLVLWPIDGGGEPTHISELASLMSCSLAPVPVELVTARGAAHTAYGVGDDFVSAAAVRLPPPSRAWHVLRFRFCSSDSRNDWTAKVRLRF